MAATQIAMSAAADYLGNGAIEVPVFESEIFDIVRRSSVTLQRFKQVRATGHPHRYFEQTAIATAASVDPRNIAATPAGPTRVERPAFIKATVAQTNISQFDKDVTAQQNQFASVIAKDVDDIISGIEIQRATMVWQGTDTSLVSPTTLQWMGGLTQITNQATMAPGGSIIDTIKTQVANMLNNTIYVPRPTAIYVSPLLADLIDQEAKAARIDLNSKEVVAGVSVKYLSTQAGDLPIIGDPFIPVVAAGTAAYGFSAVPTGYKGYMAAIISEGDVEIPVISGSDFNPNPRLFQLGLVGNLAGQFVGLKFDAIIFKAAAYAHVALQIQHT